MENGAIYAACVTAFSTILGVIFLLTFNAHDLYFHMITIPADHAFRDRSAGLLWIWYQGIKDLLLYQAIGLGLLLLALVFDGMKSQSWRGIRNWLGERSWSMLLIVLIFTLPGSLLGYMKVGGYLNSLGGTSYFMLLTALSGLVESCVTADAGLQPTLQLIVGSLLTIVGCIVGCFTLLTDSIGIVSNWQTLIHPYQNTQQVAFKYATAHPGEIYCPWNPLVTLLADGQLYHFEYGLMERLDSNHPPSVATVAAHLPSRMRAIVYLRPPLGTECQNVLTEFRREIEVADLPGCIVIERQ